VSNLTCLRQKFLHPESMVRCYSCHLYWALAVLPQRLRWEHFRWQWAFLVGFKKEERVEADLVDPCSREIKSGRSEHVH